MRHVTFKQGVHPSYNKSLTAEKKIEELPLPDTIDLPLIQHAGKPGELLKKKGDEVAIGEVVSQESGKISARLHSPVIGKIKRLSQKPLPGGRMSEYLEIEVDKEGTLSHTWEEQSKKDLDKDSLINAILEAGIVGMGGATFPTHVKYSPPPSVTLDTLIINGAECEPYLTCDHRLMLEETEKILESVRILHKAFSFKRIGIGIEANKADAIEAFEQKKSEYSDLPLDVISTETKYPEGAEKMLIYALTGREVPSGGLPFEVGVLVSNIATVIAIYEAVRLKKPLIDRVLTVSGSGIREAKNVRAPIGTPLENIAEFCGGFTEETEKIVLGGPMMGIAIPSLDYSLTKGSSGLLFLSDQDFPEEGPCIRCGSCVEACPVFLMPLKLAAYAKAGRWEDAKKLNVFDCFECGACAYRCPAYIKLTAWIKYAKNYIRINKI